MSGDKGLADLEFLAFEHRYCLELGVLSLQP